MFESRVTGQRPKISRDSRSGVVQEPETTLFKDLACSCQQARASIVALYAQRNTFVDTTIYFAQSPNLEANDRLLVTDRTMIVNYYLCQGKSAPVGRGNMYEVQAMLIREPGIS